MTGSKQALIVYLGTMQIATITLVDDQLYWDYAETWKETGYAISPHLPLHEKIPPLNVQRFLKNLLPEGNALEELVNSFHLSKYNVFGLIRALGLDVTGSLIILMPNKQPLSAKPIFHSILKFFYKLLDNILIKRQNHGFIWLRSSAG